MTEVGSGILPDGRIGLRPTVEPPTRRASLKHGDQRSAGPAVRPLVDTIAENVGVPGIDASDPQHHKPFADLV